MYEQLRQQIMRLPLQIQHPAAPASLNEPIQLYEGAMLLSGGDGAQPLHGRLLFEWLPSPHVNLEGEIEADLPPSLSGRGYSVVVPRLSLEGRCHLTSVSYKFGQTRQPSKGSLLGEVWVGGNGTADEIVFLLPNFGEYIGSGYRPPGQVGVVNGRLVMETDLWLVEVDQLPTAKETRDQVRSRGGYAVGHVGRVRKQDGSTFLREDAESLLEVLHFFFSFGRGFRCGPVLPIGRKEGVKTWERWSRANVSPYTGVASWFPTVALQEVGTVLQGFLDRWTSPEWGEIFRLGVHLYCSSNENEGALEGSLVLAQTALELLSWAYFEEKGEEAVRRAEALRGGAPARIHLLLEELGIPTALPEWPEELRDTAALIRDRGDEPIRHGPELITRVRNWIVHPRQRTRSQLRPLSNQARFQTRQLALWYIELIVLRLCGYSGMYTNRLGRSSSRMGSEEAMPWSTVSRI